MITTGTRKKNLKNFLKYLEDVQSGSRFEDILSLLPEFETLEVDNWKTCIQYENGEPCTTLMYQSEKVKLMLIYWKGNQKSAIHGHAGGGGLIKVLDGTLEETYYDPMNGVSMLDRHSLEKGQVGFIHDMFAWHQMRNPKNTPAVSIHLYSLISPAQQNV